MKKEDIINDVESMTSASLKSGHFNLELFDLGNRKFGVDIFTIAKRGKGDMKFLNLEGIYMTGSIRLMHHLGLYQKKVFDNFVVIRKDQNRISIISTKEMKDLVNTYLNQLGDLKIEIDGLYETFTQDAQCEILYRQMHLIFQERFYEVLHTDTSPLLTDTKDTSYLSFENGVLKVSGEGYEFKSYSALGSTLVWEQQVIPFKIHKELAERECHFERFVRNVCANDESRITSLKSAIGYLLHNYNHPSGGQMVLIYDEEIADLNSPRGGTGKGLIAQSIKQLRNTVKIDGKKIKGTSAFDFQNVNLDTEVIWIDDMSKSVDIDRFNSISTDGLVFEKKFQGEVHLPTEHSPKILICSNIIMDCTGTTRKRRQFIVELSPFYSDQIKDGTEEPIRDTHGCLFFSDEWDNNEWNAFYWFMISCLQQYLKSGLIAQQSNNTLENISRQKVGDDLHNWIREKDFSLDTEYCTKELFTEYKNLYEPDNARFTQRSFSNKLKMHFAFYSKDIEFYSRSDGGQKVSLFRIRN